VALDRYNAAAQALVPPQEKINWADVMEYACLADFDLLQSTQQDVRNYPWATPAAHIVMDRHFKMLHAQEEISCLNIEIAQVVTYLWDEDLYLQKREKLRCRNPMSTLLIK
jgi:Trm5-related predicted tRNA methylase